MQPQRVDIDLRDPSGAYRVVLIGAVDEMTAAYVREKVRHIARATGETVHQVEIEISPAEVQGNVVIEVKVDLDSRRVQSRIAAPSAMAAVDRFESQLRRQLESPEGNRAPTATRN